MSTDNTDNTDTPRVELAARELRPLLTGLGKAASRTGLPATRCIHVRAAKAGGAADLAATDLERWACARLPGAARGAPGEFLVPLAPLRALLKAAGPAAPVALRPAAGGRGAEVVLAGAAHPLEAPPPGDFPSPPDFEGEPAPRPAAARRAILEAAACASTDATRHVLNGVRLDTGGRGHHVVGTDGRHLYSANSSELPLAAPATLGSHPLLAWKPVREAADWRLRLARDRSGGGGSYEVTAGAWRAVGRLVDGSYPSWRQVLPDKDAFAASITVDPEQLGSLATAVKALAVERCGSHRPVTLRKEGGGVVMHWRDAGGGEPRSLPLPGAGAAGARFTVQLNQAHLAKALAFGLGHIGLGGDCDPVLFKGDGGRQLVAMPLRITRSTAPPPHTPTKPARRRLAPPPPQPKKPDPMPDRRQPKPERPSKTDPTARGAPRPGDPAPVCPIDAALAEIAAMRDTLRSASGDLGRVAAHLKQAKQQRRASQREVRSVRGALESLRKVRL